MPSPSESAYRVWRRHLLPAALALGAFACGPGSTDAPPQPDLTTVARVEVEVPTDSILVGDSLVASLRAVNAMGTVITAPTILWSSSDSSIGSVGARGVLRARNVGIVRLDVLAGGAIGTKVMRVVPRPMRVRLVAPDTAHIVDAVELVSMVETASGQPLPEVAPNFQVTNPSVVTIQPVAVGRARVMLHTPGTAELLAVIGRDTTRRTITVRLSVLRSLQVGIESRVVGLGDSLPLVIAALDTAGRAVSSLGSLVRVEPAGAMLVRNGHLIGAALGRVVVHARYDTLSASDTVTVQGPSEFPLEIVDGDGQNPVPLRVLLSMERVAQRWRRVIRSSPPGEFVSLATGECRNVVPVSQFVSGLRVLVRVDTLPSRIAGLGGPCVMRAGGLPLLGTLTLNIFTVSQLSDRKLDDLLQHEVGHVLGIGSLWGRGTLAGLVSGDNTSPDPIFVGPAALSAFGRLGRSGFFSGRRVPLEVRVLGHWRGDAFGGELMAPSLTPSAVQPTSAVTVAALRDLGWNVELEAYEEYGLPELVTPQVARGAPGSVASRTAGVAALALEGDVLYPQIELRRGGVKHRIDGSRWPLR
ncbi:MAG: hypothetical protein IT355_19485 [Gemmatimonadaceae bacterium]|nr:hypothetical protein [Gemmatimonadaceae bacterium]